MNFHFEAYYIVLAFIISVVCIFGELYVGKIVIFLEEGIWVEKVRIDDSMNKNGYFWDILFILIGAIGEEVIFRYMFYNLLVNYLFWGVWSFIVVTVFVYGINHIFFSRNAVFQKMFTGLILGIIFVVLNESIILLVLAHFLQNLLLYLHKNKRKAKKCKERG